MDIILLTKDLLQSHDGIGVASDVALKNVLSFKATCHFHLVVLSTAYYMERNYQKGSSNPS